VVDTIDDAIALERKYHQSLNLVTLDGDTMRPGGAMTGGAYRRSENLLGRKRQLDELSEQCKSLQDELIKINESMDGSSRDREEAAADEKEIRERYNALIVEKKNKEHDLSLLNDKKADETKAYEDIVNEETEIRKKLAQMDEEQNAFDEKLKAVHLKESDIEEKTKQLEADRTRIEGSIKRLNDRLSDIRVQKAALSEKITAATERLSRFKESEADALKLLEDLKNKKASGSQESESKKREIEDLKAEIEKSRALKEDLTNQIRTLTDEKDELDKKSQGIFDQSESISQEISVLEKESLKLDQRIEKNTGRFNELSDYMWDQYEITKHEAEALADNSLTDLNEIKKESKGIQSDIREMGSVNVNAVEEYDEISKRYTFMSSQHDDLLAAKEKLLTIINDLDAGMRQQFESGFRDIQREFDKAFKELFGGGHGRIALADDEDILESDINIIASPPGKKLTNMMQMSGGEKSLTAIALLFAIQNLHPSPFCLLDEIEAALDDSNVDRFAHYLGKLTDHTQFIVITHRRGTMNAADRLYGITMQEKGVSTLVSVNLIEDQLK
ncbi:MAG: chromosome segregation protein SMC, partial [Candidatus Weimeria sp.]